MQFDQLKRRHFIMLLGASVAWPLTVRAQQGGTVARVGVLGPSLESPASKIAYPAFLGELRQLGFTEGQNLVVEFRRIDQGMPKAFTGANELAAAKANVLFAFGPELALQAAAATRPALPIVILANNYDPIARGYVASLAQPGGNITGIFSRQPELAVKQLALLAEAFPDRTRVAALWDEQSADQFSEAERAAQSMRLSLRSLKLDQPPYDFASAFHALAQDGAQMLLVMSSPLFARQNTRIAELAIQHRLPTMYILRHYVDVGGLMSYGVNFTPMMRRAASFVAKILRGAQPADLPVEQVTNFEFVVNLKTAKAIGVTLPTSILLRADEVIE
jgi:putative tryptophan/tyrosine transport system substrate-binding protein